MSTTSIRGRQEDKVLMCLFRDYSSYAMVLGVAVIANAVNLPLQRVFRYTGTDVSYKLPTLLA